MKITRICQTSLSICLFLLGSLDVVYAQSGSEGGALGDHPLIARFPDSEIISLEVTEESNYRLVLGTLQRTRGVVEPENSRLLRGDVTRIIYQVAPQFDGEDVYQFFYEQMLEKNYTELFSCAGRGCGSSNYWANDIFKNRVLYGPERNQHFLAMRAGADEEHSPHISLYIIKRANRSLYAYFEIVEENASRAVTSIVSPELLESLNEQGSAVLVSLAFVNDGQLVEEANLEEVVNLLESEPALRIYLVAHLGGSEPLDNLLRRSQARAEFVARQLVQLGIDAERIVPRGVGPLAPTCTASSDCGDRIELVLQ
jgi:hypothetical protein